MNQKREVDTKTAQLEVWALENRGVRRGRRVRGRRLRNFIGVVGMGEG